LAPSGTRLNTGDSFKSKTDNPKGTRQLPGHTVAVAIVVAHYIPDSVALQVKKFARRHAPNIAVGVMDLEGMRSFVGHGLELEQFNSERPRARNTISPANRVPSPQLFSDLN
jgi:hypothetical protein